MTLSQLDQESDLQAISGAPRRKGRSGSSKRQRTQQLKLSLLPAEELKLRDAAERDGFPNVQALILHSLAPVLASAAS